MAHYEAPLEVRRLMAMTFNNFWYRNFVGDGHGIVEFQFDLIWQPETAGPAADLAEAVLTELVVLINPATPEDQRVIRHLYEPLLGGDAAEAAPPPAFPNTAREPGAGVTSVRR